MLFKQIPGIENLKKLLIQNARNGRIAHAQLFAGNEGSCLLMLALAYAQYINCENKGADDSCGLCPSCSKISKQAHPDLHFAFPTAKVKDEKEDARSDRFMPDFRKFLAQTPFGDVNTWAKTAGFEARLPIITTEEAKSIIQKLALKAFEAQYKVIVIWHPESMHTNGLNSLLKILEEPPANTVFLLVSTQPNKLLPTILSRVVRVAIPDFTDEDVAGYLENKYQVSSNEAQQIARLAGGNLLEAFHQAKHDHSEDFQELFAGWMRACFKSDVLQLVSFTDRFSDLGREKQKAFLQFCINRMHHALVALCDGERTLRLTDSELEWLKKFSSALNLKLVEKISRIFDEAWLHIERNVNGKMVFLDSSFLIVDAVFKKNSKKSTKRLKRA